MVWTAAVVFLPVTLALAQGAMASDYDLMDPYALGSGYDLSRTIYLNSTYVAYAVAAGAVIILIIAIGLYLYDYYYGSTSKSSYTGNEYSGYYYDHGGSGNYGYSGQKYYQR